MIQPIYLSFRRVTTGSLFAVAIVAASVHGAGAASVVDLRASRPVTPIAERPLVIADEDDVRAPIDYGPGPGLPAGATPVTRKFALMKYSTSGASVGGHVPVGGSLASTAGTFGPAVSWPLIPLHMVLLPDGRVMSYGTSGTGAQTGQFIYDVWDPTLGTDTSAHQVLPNTTNTDLFCSAQSLMVSGEVLSTGGDLTVNGARNSANNNTTIFSPSANTLTENTAMTYARWYGSLVALPNAELAVFGGRENVGAVLPAQPALTPERYSPSLRAWQSLTGATSNPAFGNGNWYYPRAYVAPGGKVFVVHHNGPTFYVSTAGNGSTVKSSVSVPLGDISLPTISYAPGKALSVRQNQQAVVIDFTTSTPVVTPTAKIDQVRFWASGTIMADGRVLVTGGSTVANQLTGVAYQAQIWDPSTGLWGAGASATKPRLYHSNSMLLTDGTVITSGGGAPGPVINLNAEIYYPPYLYAADGSPAVRPVITGATTTVLSPGQVLNITVGATDTLAHLHLVRMGSATHSNNSDQRFIPLAFNQSVQTVSATLPSDTSVLVPGYYMLFAVNTAGVPSVALVLNVT